MGIATAALLLTLVTSLPDKLVLAPGEHRELALPGLVRVAVAAPAIADIKTIGPEALLITATGLGETTLTVWTSDGKQHSMAVTVRAPLTFDEFPSQLGWRWRPGDAESWKHGSLGRVESSNPEIIAVTKREGRVMLSAKKPGRATVIAFGAKDASKRIVIDVLDAANSREAACALNLSAVELATGGYVTLLIAGLTSARIDYPVAVVSVPEPGRLVIHGSAKVSQGQAQITVKIGETEAVIPLTIP